MAKAREQTCTMSHQAGSADCVWAHSPSWALRVMNTGHRKGTQHCTWPHFQLPLIALGNYWHLRPFWLDTHPACQTGKAGPCQNTPCLWRMGAADPQRIWQGWRSNPAFQPWKLLPAILQNFWESSVYSWDKQEPSSCWYHRVCLHSSLTKLHLAASESAQTGAAYCNKIWEILRPKTITG